jgi:hypothetical protein
MLLVVFLPIFVHSQDFQNICSPQTTYYKSPGYGLKAFRRDSTVITGMNDTTFYSYRTILNLDGTACKDTIGGSVMGRKVFKRDDGWFYFFNRGNDTIFLNSQGVTGTTWKFCNLPNSCYLQAEITSIVMDSVLGNLDQVKIITLQAKNNLNINIPHFFNQKQIRLSKNYGISKMYDLYLMPNDTVPYTLCGKTFLSLGIQNLKWKDIYNYNEGDIFHYSGIWNSQYGGGSWNKIYRVLSKAVYGNNDSVEYKMEHCERVSSGYPPAITNTFDTITVKYNWALYDLNYSFINRLPDEFVHSGAFSDRYFQNINAFNGRHLKGRDINKYHYASAQNCWGFYGYGGTPVYTYNYVEGLGQTYYSYYVIPELQPTSAHENLVYFKKGTETWGTPVTTTCNTLVPVDDKLLLPEVHVLVFPNPITSRSTISLINLDLSSHPEIFMMDLYGRIVFHTLVQKSEVVFDRQGVPAGIYILRVTSNDGVVRNKKIIVSN